MSTIISWNLWQMDGLPDPATLKKRKKQSTTDIQNPTTSQPQHSTHCMIRLWENTDPQEDTIPFSEGKTTDSTLF